MTSTASDAANDAMIREFFQAWERRDTDQIVASFTDDAVYHNISLEPLVGKAEIRDFVAGYEGRPAEPAEIRHQLATGNLVMNERVDHVTLGDRKFDVPICGVFEIRDGRISRWTDYYDSGQFLSR
jgi:limonene-1,2-epoxide hydrolase